MQVLLSQVIVCGPCVVWQLVLLVACSAVLVYQEQVFLVRRVQVSKDWVFSILRGVLEVFLGPCDTRCVDQVLLAVLIAVLLAVLLQLLLV